MLILNKEKIKTQIDQWVLLSQQKGLLVGISDIGDFNHAVEAYFTHPCVYLSVNAWQKSLLGMDPLTVMMGELGLLMTKRGEEPWIKTTLEGEWNNLKKAWFDYRRGGNPTVIGGIRAAANVASGGLAGDLMDMVTGKVSDQASDLLQQYAGQVRGINQIKEHIKSLAAASFSATGRPLVWWVSDLDMCQPDAHHGLINWLNVLKHIWLVPHVLVLTPIDQPHLKASIELVYGQGGDSLTRLNRWFDQMI